MARLIDLLPPDHPIRSRVSDRIGDVPPEPEPEPKPRKSGSKPIKARAPLYLVTYTYIGMSHRKVDQLYISDTPSGILTHLKAKFKMSEVEDLILGLPVDDADGVKQYKLEPRLPKEKLGLIRLKEPTPMTKKQEAEPQSQPTPAPQQMTRLEWGAVLRKYRMEAGYTQEDLSRKINPLLSNIMSSMEYGKRLFSPSERDAFFKLVGKPVDLNIPVASPEQVSARESYVQSLKTTKTAPAAQAVAAAAPASAKPAAKKPAAQPKPRVFAHKAPKPTPEILEAQEPVVEVEVEPTVTSPAPAPAPQPRPAAPVVAVEPEIVHIPEIAGAGLSAVKQAALKDLHATVASPNLSDKQVAEVMSLFKSILVPVLLR